MSALTDCPTPHRQAHGTREKAAIAVKVQRQRHRRRLQPYWCTCGSWHVGPVDDVAANGVFV